MTTATRTERPMTPERMAQTPEQAGVEPPRGSQWTYTDEEQRRMAVLSAYGMSEALTGLDALADQVPALEFAVTQAKMDLTLAEEHVDLVEAELRASVEGKNAEERKDALVRAKAGDERYQGYVHDVLACKAKVNEAEREARTARHRERYWQVYVEARAAQLRYLAG